MNPPSGGGHEFETVLDASNLSCGGSCLTVPQKILLELKDKGRNLLENGGFELGSRDFRVKGWQNRSWEFSPNKDIDFARENVWQITDETAYEGKKSLMLTCPPGFSMAETNFFSIPLRIGERYTVSFYAKSDTGASVQAIVFGMSGTRSSSQRSYSSFTANIPKSGEWTRFSKTFTDENYFGTLDLRCDNRDEGGKFQKAYIDCVQFERGGLSDYDSGKLRFGAVADDRGGVVFPGMPVRMSFLCQGNPGSDFKAKVELRRDGSLTVETADISGRLDVEGRCLSDYTFKSPGTGVFTVESRAESGSDTARAAYRLSVIDKLPEKFKNADLFSVFSSGVNPSSWKRFLESFRTFGIHWARTVPPAGIIDRYFKGKSDFPFNIIWFSLAEYYGAPEKGKVAAWEKKYLKDVIPFELTPSLESEIRKEMRENFAKNAPWLKLYCVINEPNAPQVYYQKDGLKTGYTPETVAELTRWAWEEKNKINPEIKLAGPTTFNADFDWIDRYLELGAGKYLDYLDFHCYNWDPEKFMDDNPARLKSILKKHNLPNLRLMSSEFGLYHPKHIPEIGSDAFAFNDHGDINVCLDYRIDKAELYHSRLVARNYLLALKHDFFTISYFLYDNAWDFSLLMDANLVPLAHLPVMVFANSEFGRMRYHSQVEYDEHTRAEIYEGPAPDGGSENYGKAAVWCSLKEVCLGALQSPSLDFSKTADGCEFALRSHSGERITMAKDKCLPVIGPVYVSVKRDGRLLSAAELAEFLNRPELKNPAGNIIRSKMEFFNGKIVVSQKSRSAETGVCSLSAAPNFPFKYKDASWDGKKEMSAVFEPFDITKLKPFDVYNFTLVNKLQNKTVAQTFKKSFYAARPSENPGEFAGLENRKNFAAQTASGRDDFSALARVSWSGSEDAGLTLELSVRDKELVVIPEKEDMASGWKYDSITVYIDTMSDGSNAKPGSGLDSNDYRYDFALSGNGLVYRAANPNYQDCFLVPKQIDKEVSFDLKKDSGGYSAKIVFPATRLLPFRAGAGKILRMAVFINNNNGAGRESAVTTSPVDTDPYDSPSLWTDVLLIK